MKKEVYMKQNKTKVMVTQARQGDVFVINEKDKNLRLETRQRLFDIKLAKKLGEKERTIPLAFGEVSGHAHQIMDRSVGELSFSKDVQETLKHLEVKGNATLTHEE